MDCGSSIESVQLRRTGEEVANTATRSSAAQRILVVCTRISSNMNLKIRIVTLALPIVLASCASYGPYHPNTSAEPLDSVRGPSDGRYKLAFIEFGDQGSALDTSQRTAALEVIQEAKRPLLFVYIHGWQNNAESGEVCRFEHFTTRGLSANLIHNLAYAS